MSRFTASLVRFCAVAHLFAEIRLFAPFLRSLSEGDLPRLLCVGAASMLISSKGPPPPKPKKRFDLPSSSDEEDNAVNKAYREKRDKCVVARAAFCLSIIGSRRLQADGGDEAGSDNRREDTQ
jgi:hypothetical protein